MGGLGWVMVGEEGEASWGGVERVMRGERGGDGGASDRRE